MKVALAFWGLTRSLKYTIDSINTKILNILKKHNIEYKIFMHTWTINSTYNNKDPWNTKYETVNNFICAMFSKSRCTQLIKNSNEFFDYIIFLRPDCMYLTDFNILFFNLVNNQTICIPNFALYNNFNDRFSLTNMTTYQLYGDVFSKLFKYSKKHPLHSETFHYHIIKNKKLHIKLINFHFSRVRANGFICPN